MNNIALVAAEQYVNDYISYEAAAGKVDMKDMAAFNQEISRLENGKFYVATFYLKGGAWERVEIPTRNREIAAGYAEEMARKIEAESWMMVPVNNTI